MIYLEKYKQIMKIKNSRNPKFKTANIKYCTKVLEKILKGKKVYNIEDINDLEKNLQGVYLIYSVDCNGNLKLTYVGESTDIQSRWKSHIYNFKNKIKPSTKIRKLEKNVNNLRFVILAKTTEQNQRLKTETYYIYTFRSGFISANTKLASKKLRCDFGHGVKRTYLGYKVIEQNFELYIYGYCWNKACEKKFIINKSLQNSTL